MTRVIVDSSLLQRLHDLSQPLELCDTAGRVLARVTPVPEGDVLEPQVSEEELRRREQSEEWHTTAEVLARLKER